MDVLWNNAGVMIPPEGSKTKQGYELQLGINNLGHFLFTYFLTPILQKTAKTSAPNSVRVLWVSSSAADAAPRPAIDFSNMDYARKEGQWSPYMRSKAGSVIHSVEFARRTAGSGIISIVSNRLPFLGRAILLSSFLIIVCVGTQPREFRDRSPAEYANHTTGNVCSSPLPSSYQIHMFDTEVLNRNFWHMNPRRELIRSFSQAYPHPLPTQITADGVSSSPS